MLAYIQYMDPMGMVTSHVLYPKFPPKSTLEFPNIQDVCIHIHTNYQLSSAIYIYIYIYTHTYIHTYIHIYTNIFDMYISIFVCISPKVPMVSLLISGLALDYQVLPTQQCGAGWNWRTAPVVVLEIPWKLAGEVWLSVRVSSMKNCSESGISSLELLVIHGDSLFTTWSN